MAFLRNLKQNINSLQIIFKKKKRGSTPSSENETSLDNESQQIRTSEELTPRSSSLDSTRMRMGQGSSTVDDLSNKGPQSTRAFLARRDPRLEKTQECHHHSVAKSHDQKVRRKGLHTGANVMESDSEPDEQGVPRCQCSRSSGNESIQANLLAEEFYGAKEKSRLFSYLDGCKTLPSTSQQAEKHRSRSSHTTDTGRSSCSLEEQMEEMVSRLKTRGSFVKRRSRSRSRRSKTRQSCENGVIVHDVSLVSSFPLRETDSDDSNTESSFHDLPPNFLSSVEQSAPSFVNNQSNSSFQSITGSDDVTPRSPSPYNEADAEDEGEDARPGRRHELMDFNSAANNRSIDSPSIDRQIQELSAYGPEDFVLDLLLAMCRGSWSDIL